jgi:hypothetical protein
MRGAMALLLVAAPTSFAQSLPPLALALSPEGVRALDQDFNEQLQALDAFGRKQSMDRFKDGGYERVKRWTLYGRLGIFNFQDALDPSRSEGAQITFRRTGPKLTGRYYIGIHRTF